MWGDIPSSLLETAVHILKQVKAVDPLTYEHCLRVGRYSRILARFAGLNEYEQRVAEYSGIFHDIGKVGIPLETLHKNGPLNNQEFQWLKEHPVMSELLIASYKDNSFFADLLPGIRNHHERIDGRGYPDGLKDEEIPLFARVVLIVDAFDAMTQSRAYRKSQSMAFVLKELERCAGTQFDKGLVNVFLDAKFAWQKEINKALEEDDSSIILLQAS